jgi:hypothetical protein
MTLTDKQVECARTLIDQTTGPDAEWLDNRLQEYISATAYGDEQDIEDAARRIYAEAPEDIGQRIFGARFERES